MKSLLLPLITFIAVLLPVTAMAEVQGFEVPTREDMVVTSMTAKVTAIDYQTRDITLQNELGKEVTISASDLVERFDEISVGDFVVADYYISVAFELREPTAEEVENPLQVEQAEERAGLESAPAGGFVNIIKAVGTIEGLDRPTATVTLMGLMGGLNVVKVADVDNLPNLRIGQSVIVTFTEALVIALEEVEP